MELPSTRAEMEQEFNVQLTRDEAQDIEVKWDGAYLVFAELRRNMVDGERYMPYAQHVEIVGCLREVLVELFEELNRLRDEERNFVELRNRCDILQTKLGAALGGINVLREHLAPTVEHLRVLFEFAAVEKIVA